MKMFGRCCTWWAVMCFLALTVSAQAATGRVIKVLPQFLDLKGRVALSPSLYERDAYQFQLQQHPKEQAGLRFAIQWKSKGPVWEPLTLRLELRGIVRGTLPRQLVLDRRVEPSGWFGRWTAVDLAGAEYQEFGEVTAWRVTLWEGQQVLGEQKSFLW